MTDTTLKPQDDRLLALADQAKRIMRLQASIEREQREVADIKAHILDQWPAGNYDADGLKVSVIEGRRTLNTRKFEELFPAQNNPTLYNVKPKSLARIQSILGSQVEECVSRTAPAVSVR